jgi:GAF domain-containing protein
MHTPDSRLRAPARGIALRPATSSAARALAAASALFTTTTDTSDLLRTVARTLALEPGQMCLVSLVHQDVLQPVVVDHAGMDAANHLRSLIVPGRATPADAFSLQALRTGRTYKMPIGDPRLPPLWLPSAYWSYTERVHINGVLAAPLRTREERLGALLLWRENGAPAFDEADADYVDGLAARLAVALALSGC